MVRALITIWCWWLLKAVLTAQVSSARGPRWTNWPLGVAWLTQSSWWRDSRLPAAWVRARLSSDSRHSAWEPAENPQKIIIQLITAHELAHTVLNVNYRLVYSPSGITCMRLKTVNLFFLRTHIMLFMYLYFTLTSQFLLLLMFHQL